MLNCKVLDENKVDKVWVHSDTRAFARVASDLKNVFQPLSIETDVTNVKLQSYPPLRIEGSVLTVDFNPGE